VHFILAATCVASLTLSAAAAGPPNPAALQQESVARQTAALAHTQRAAARQAALAVGSANASMALQHAAVALQLKAGMATTGTIWSGFPQLGFADSAPSPPACAPLRVDQLAPLIHQAAIREGVSPDLIRAVILAESGSRPCAVSSKGALGLMQLMPDSAAEIGVHDPFDARASIDGGAKLLKRLLMRYHGAVDLALAAYNAGAARVDAAGSVPEIAETRTYVRRILADLNR